jgi:electron transport complex protein RnfD
MGDTILPLLFLLAISVFYYGFRALTLTATSVLSCIVFEYLYRRILGKSNSIGDLSAVITGMITAFCMPVTVPLWFPVVGGFFSIVIVKQLFGGLGRNIFNPAAAAVCMLTVTWPGVMSVFPLPTSSSPLSAFATPQNFETGRTVLAALKSGQLPDNNISDLLFGYTPGNFGTAAILVIAIAAFVLLYRRIISFHIPVAFLGTVAAAALIFPRCPSGRLDSVMYELMSGSLLFIAVFVATDPVTSPVTHTGRVLYGICCGLLTVLMRYFGIFPEGAIFAVLLVNPFVLVFDRLGWKLRVKGGRLLYEKE